LRGPDVPALALLRPTGYEHDEPLAVAPEVESVTRAVANPALDHALADRLVVSEIPPAHPLDRGIDPVGGAGGERVEPGLEWALATLGDEEFYSERGLIVTNKILSGIPGPV
jgi:hypothetical protein